MCYETYEQLLPSPQERPSYTVYEPDIQTTARVSSLPQERQYHAVLTEQASIQVQEGLQFRQAQYSPQQISENTNNSGTIPLRHLPISAE